MRDDEDDPLAFFRGLKNAIAISLVVYGLVTTALLLFLD